MGANILLIGNGAREHALAEAIKNSKHKPRLHCFMNARNPGLLNCSESSFVGDITNPEEILQFATKVRATLAVIGPEAPLAAGVTDALQRNISVIGPTKAAAQIETSKSFARYLFEKYNINASPRYKTCTSLQQASDMLKQLDGYVIKADGLRSGKGVKLSGEHLATKEEANEYAQECIAKDGRVVIEEKLVGEEFSLMSFSDGNTLRHMPLVQDHKRAYENDTGPDDANHAQEGMYMLCDPKNNFNGKRTNHPAKRIRPQNIRNNTR